MKRELKGFIEATARAAVRDLPRAPARGRCLYRGSAGVSGLAPRPQSPGFGVELVLDLLGRAHVEELLANRYPGSRFPEAFAALLHATTEGRPLFLVDLLRWRVARGEIAVVNEAWQLTGTMPSFERDLPLSVRGMIQRTIEPLDESTVSC